MISFFLIPHLQKWLCLSLWRQARLQSTHTASTVRFWSRKKTMPLLMHCISPHERHKHNQRAKWLFTTPPSEESDCNRPRPEWESFQLVCKTTRALALLRREAPGRQRGTHARGKTVSRVLTCIFHDRICYGSSPLIQMHEALCCRQAGTHERFDTPHSPPQRLKYNHVYIANCQCQKPRDKRSLLGGCEYFALQMAASSLRNVRVTHFHLLNIQCSSWPLVNGVVL